MAAHRQPSQSRSGAGGYALALVGALVATALATMLEQWTGLHDLSPVFLLAVLAVAARTRTGPAVLAAVLCFLAYNFFFIAPRMTLYVSAPRGVATVLLFLAAALLAGRMASRLGTQLQALREAQRHDRARQRLGERLATARSPQEVDGAVREVFGTLLETQAWLRVSPPSIATAIPVRETIEQYGWWFLPLQVGPRTLGSLALKLPEHTPTPDLARQGLVRMLCEDIAQALERMQLLADLQAERVAAESARARGALLASVSHDLRTPLAAILGATDSLQGYGARLDAADRDALLSTIAEEGLRLDRYIQNLLDMTRLEHAPLVPVCEWIDADDLLGSALRRLQRYRPGAQVAVAMDAQAGPLWVQPALLEQALFNIIDNAVEFSPPDTAVRVEVRPAADGPCIEVHDAGPGIPEAERERVFEMFYSAHRGDRQRRGTGLGLAISRGIIHAHGGRVQALPGDAGGTTMRIELPDAPAADRVQRQRLEATA